MNAVRPRLITFDVTGTLLLTKVVEHYESIGVQHGITINRNKLAPSFKRSYKKLTKDHPIYGRHTGLGWQKWWTAVVYDVFKDQDLKINQHTLDKIAAGLIQNYATSECWHKYPGTEELLQHLKSHRNVTLGVISNFDERLEAILQDTQIRPYFNFVITSYGLGIEKPDPGIFKEALTLSKTKCGVNILPHNALHIGDTVDRDYFGAKTAGWDAILINHEKNEIDYDKVPKENVVENLQELKKKLSLFLEKSNV